MDGLKYTSIEIMKLRVAELTAILENSDFSETPDYEKSLIQERDDLTTFLNSIFYA